MGSKTYRTLGAAMCLALLIGCGADDNAEGNDSPVETDPPAETDPPPAETDPPVETDAPPVETDAPPVETDPPPVETDPPAETDPPVQRVVDDGTFLVIFDYLAAPGFSGGTFPAENLISVDQQNQVVGSEQLPLLQPMSGPFYPGTNTFSMTGGDDATYFEGLVGLFLPGPKLWACTWGGGPSLEAQAQELLLQTFTLFVEDSNGELAPNPDVDLLRTDFENPDDLFQFVNPNASESDFPDFFWNGCAVADLVAPD